MNGWGGVTVAVTGSSGFIGGHLARRLAGLGARVVGIDRRDPGPGAPWGHLRCDVTVPAARPLLQQVFSEADVVFHLAARAGVRDPDPGAAEGRRRDNVLATLAVAAATPARVPLVVTSSSSVYGGSAPGRGPHGAVRPSREGDPLRPRGSYARTKVLVERTCALRAARGGLVAVARPFTVVGERQRPDMALARWIAALRRAEPVTVLGSPGRSRDLTDVGLVVRALLALAEHLPAGPINVGTGRPVTLGAAVRAVGEALGVVPEIRVTAAPAADPPHTCAHVGRLRGLLGRVPPTDLREVVARLVAEGTTRPARPAGARVAAGAVDLHSGAASANMVLHSPC